MKNSTLDAMAAKATAAASATISHIENQIYEAERVAEDLEKHVKAGRTSLKKLTHVYATAEPEILTLYTMRLKKELALQEKFEAAVDIQKGIIEELKAAHSAATTRYLKTLSATNVLKTRSSSQGLDEDSAAQDAFNIVLDGTLEVLQKLDELEARGGDFAQLREATEAQFTRLKQSFLARSGKV